MRNDFKMRNHLRGGGIAKRGLGAALRGGGIAKRGMGVALKDGGDVKQDKALIKKAFKMHDAQEHKGEHTKLDKLKKGGKAESVSMMEGKTKTKKAIPEKEYMRKEAKVSKPSEEDKAHERAETPEKEAREEAKMKKGGRAMKASGGGLKPIGELRAPRKVRSALDYMKKGGRAKKKYGGKC